MKPDSELLLGAVYGRLDVLRNTIDEYCSDEQWVTWETHDALIKFVDTIQGMVRKIKYLEDARDHTIKCDFCGAEIREPKKFDPGTPTGVSFVHPDGSLTTLCAKCMIRLGMVKDDEDEEVDDERQDSTV